MKSKRMYIHSFRSSFGSPKIMFYHISTALKSLKRKEATKKYFIRSLWTTAYILWMILHGDIFQCGSIPEISLPPFNPFLRPHFICIYILHMFAVCIYLRKDEKRENFISYPSCNSSAKCPSFRSILYLNIIVLARDQCWAIDAFYDTQSFRR